MCWYVYLARSTTENSDRVHHDKKQSLVNGDFVSESFVLILQLIRSEKTFQIRQLDTGHAAEPLWKLLSPRTHWAHWTSFLCVPNSLPIPFWLNIQIAGQGVLALLFCTDNSAPLASHYPGLCRLWASKSPRVFFHPWIWRCVFSPWDFSSTHNLSFLF